MLSDEQLEDIIRGRVQAPEEMDPRDSRRVAEMRAVRDRLRSAMASVQMDEPAAERIRRAVRDAASAGEQSPARAHAAPRIIRFPRLARWLPAVAAAIIIAVAIPFLLPDTPTAQAELAGIHNANVSGGGEFHHESDPDKVVRELEKKLGYAPAVPPLQEGASIVGCCVKVFRGRPAATYLLKLPRGKVSIVVTPDEPETMKLKRHFEHNGIHFCACGHEKCKMVALRLGNYTYVALGEMSHEALIELLLKLLPDEAGRGE